MPMKPYILFACFVALSFIAMACHPSETISSPTDAQDSSAKEAKDSSAKIENSNPAQEKNMLDSAMMDNKISSYFRERKEESTKAPYEEARKIVEAQKNITKEIQVRSKRINQWFILVFSSDPVDPPGMLDAPSRYPDKAFVVDLNKGKVIDENDFASVCEMYKALNLKDHKPNAAENLEKEFTDNLSAITSAVAFNTWEVMTDFLPGQRFPGDVGPSKLDIDGDKVTLTYFINRTAMAQEFHKCQLTITSDKCEFKSEFVNP